MNSSIVFVIAFLCGMVSCISFKWESALNLTVDKEINKAVYQTSADGFLHFFWERQGDVTNSFVYQVLFPNKTFGEQTVIKGMFKKDRFRDITAQVSDNGKHLYVAYIGRGSYSSCNDTFTNPCPKIYFIESLDGGKDWSEPVQIESLGKVPKGYLSPSMVLDKEREDLYISFLTDKEDNSNLFTLKLAIKRPDRKGFKIYRVKEILNDEPTAVIGLTIAKENSERYLHILALAQDYKLPLQYFRSQNGGITWSDPIVLRNANINLFPTHLHTDTVIDSEGVYVQYKHRHEGWIIRRSVNHEYRFKRGIEIIGNHLTTAKLVLCGSDKRKILLATTNTPSVPTISFLPLDERQFQRLPFAFEDVKAFTWNSVAVTCRYLGSSNYSITHFAQSGNGLLHVAQGVLHLD